MEMWSSHISNSRVGSPSLAREQVPMTMRPQLQEMKTRSQITCEAAELKDKMQWSARLAPTAGARERLNIA